MLRVQRYITMQVNEQIMYHEGGRGAILKLKTSVVEELVYFCLSRRGERHYWLEKLYFP